MSTILTFRAIQFHSSGQKIWNETFRRRRNQYTWRIKSLLVVEAKAFRPRVKQIELRKAERSIQ